MKRAVCILSGGLDSAGTASYWKFGGYDIYLLTFDYGQRAKAELKSAMHIGSVIGAVEHRFIDISFMKGLWGCTNVLTDESKQMPSEFQPNIVVPVRNAVFLTIATAWAFSVGAEVVAYGAHKTDQPYPDCRPEFTKALESALNLGDVDAVKRGDHPQVRIWSPYVDGLEKWELLRITYSMIGEDVYQTWSCYLDGDIHCGVCESCRNRRAGFQKAGIVDKTVYLR